MAIQVCTASALASLYALLTNQEKIDFLGRIGAHSTVDGVLGFLRSLPPADLVKFNDSCGAKIAEDALPIMIRLAIDTVRDYPQATREQLYAHLEDRAKQQLETMVCEMSALALAEKKKTRDRKPDPFTMERDREIVRLRDAERRTFGDVARRTNGWLKKRLGRELNPKEKLNYRSAQAAYKRATK